MAKHIRKAEILNQTYIDDNDVRDLGYVMYCLFRYKRNILHTCFVPKTSNSISDRQKIYMKMFKNNPEVEFKDVTDIDDVPKDIFITPSYTKGILQLRTYAKCDMVIKDEILELIHHDDDFRKYRILRKTPIVFDDTMNVEQMVRMMKEHQIKYQNILFDILKSKINVEDYV